MNQIYTNPKASLIREKYRELKSSRQMNIERKTKMADI